MQVVTRFGKLLRRLHRDERGALTLETILIIAAIALPILIIIVQFVFPGILDWFKELFETLRGSTDNAIRN